MHIETEAKIKVDDLNLYRHRLEALGAHWELKRIERDCFYDNPEKRLVQGGSGLRLRQETNHLHETRTIMCYKGRIEHNGSYKQRREIEVVVDDLKRTQLLLESLGFELYLTFEKVRSLWHYRKCEVCLDHIVELGNFVEIEGPGEQIIEQVVHDLSLEDFDHVPISYSRQLMNLLQQQEGQSHRRVILLEHADFDFEAWMK